MMVSKRRNVGTNIYKRCFVELEKCNKNVFLVLCNDLKKLEKIQISVDILNIS